MNREITPGRIKRIRRCPVIIVTVADTLSSSIKVVSRAGVAEAERRCAPLAGAAHSTSQGLSQPVRHV